MKLEHTRIPVALATWSRRLRMARPHGVRLGEALPTTHQGQALVETALVLPLLLFLAFGVLAVGRVTQAQMGVSAVAREEARAAALADSPDQALRQALTMGKAVAQGYHLSDGSLRLAVDLGGFQRGSDVRASAQYIVRLDDLPLLGGIQIPVRSTHVERIDLYRSRWSAGGGP